MHDAKSEGNDQCHGRPKVSPKPGNEGNFSAIHLANSPAWQIAASPRQRTRGVTALRLGVDHHINPLMVTRAAAGSDARSSPQRRDEVFRPIAQHRAADTQWRAVRTVAAIAWIVRTVSFVSPVVRWIVTAAVQVARAY